MTSSTKCQENDRACDTGCHHVHMLINVLNTAFVSCTGGLVHFNCHNQELPPFRPAGIALVIEKLLVGCDTTEDALAAAFCLLRCAQPPWRWVVWVRVG